MRDGGRRGRGWRAGGHCVSGTGVTWMFGLQEAAGMFGPAAACGRCGVGSGPCIPHRMDAATDAVGFGDSAAWIKRHAEHVLHLCVQ